MAERQRQLTRARELLLDQPAARPWSPPTALVAEVAPRGRAGTDRDRFGGDRRAKIEERPHLPVATADESGGPELREREYAGGRVRPLGTERGGDRAGARRGERHRTGTVGIAGPSVPAPATNSIAIAPRNALITWPRLAIRPAIGEKSRDRRRTPGKLVPMPFVDNIFQPTHLLLILVVALLVLGPKRLPEAGRAIGAGIRDFRSAMTGERTRAARPARQPGPSQATVEATQPPQAQADEPARRLSRSSRSADKPTTAHLSGTLRSRGDSCRRARCDCGPAQDGQAAVG